MQNNKLFKGLLIALPMLALSACSSTSGTSTTGQSSNEATNGQTGSQQEVVTGAVKPVMSPEEQRKQHMADLRREHTIFFDFDSYNVRPEFAELLEAHATYLRDHPGVKVLIEGFTDERGTPEYNIALGERRAKAVKQYLEGLGVLDSQITLISYGEEKPLDAHHTEAAYAKNRRAVLVY